MTRLLAVLLILVGLPAGAETRLTVMTFNIWGGGAIEGKSFDETVAAIRAAGADVVGIQETKTEPETCDAEVCPATGPSVAGEIAAALGWQVQEQTGESPALWANAVISRHPITGISPAQLGVKLDVEGQEVWLFNIHLDDAPYQPYQLKGIEYGPYPFISTEAEAQKFATETRGPAMDLVLSDMEVAKDAAAVFVTGDFNEPSGLDWTEAAVTAGQKPVKVDFPTTRRLTDAGFVDLYRAIHPDPVAKPAYTWTPRYDEAATDDTPDRIDFVFARAAGLKVISAAIVGEDGPRSDIKVMPWPSDHRAVVAEVAF